MKLKFLLRCLPDRTIDSSLNISGTPIILKRKLHTNLLDTLYFTISPRIDEDDLRDWTIYKLIKLK